MFSKQPMEFNICKFEVCPITISELRVSSWNPVGGAGLRQGEIVAYLLVQLSLALFSLMYLVDNNLVCRHGASVHHDCSLHAPDCNHKADQITHNVQ